MNRQGLITQEAAGRPVLAHGRLTAWRAVDLVTLAVLGVAFGVAFWGFANLLYTPLEALLAGFPPAKELMLGVWLVPAVAGALIVRRPGAALLCELVAAGVEMMLGQQWGTGVLISGVLQALGVELVFALVRWRRFGLALAVAAGVAAAALEILAYEWWAYVPEFSTSWKLIYLAAGLVSGALLAGVGGYYLVRALAATGALDAFPPGQERLYATAEPLHDAFPLR